MLIEFFLALRKEKIPVTVQEFLALLEGLREGLSYASLEEFHALARLCLVKDESNFDKFDRVFSRFLRAVAEAGDADEKLLARIPEQWLRRLSERDLSDQEKRALAGLGSLEKLMQTLQERLAEQKERHEGGSRWIGTAGTSPFGAYGYHPEGVRIGQEGSRQRRAVKVWDRREFQDLDDSVELGTRNLKLALRRLRRFAREGACEELDIPGTIRATAGNAGTLDLKMVPMRHNKVKVLILFDVGGSMDPHVRICEELFCAARSEFKHLDYLYFHNCVYQHLWRTNARRDEHSISLSTLTGTFQPDCKLILVGDASMASYEIERPGGSVEHHNPEPGKVSMRRLLGHFTSAVWLNPVQQSQWDYTMSIQLMRGIMGGKMFPLTVAGLGMAIKHLK